MDGKFLNILAATGSTMGSALLTWGVYVSLQTEPSGPNQIFLWGGICTTLGGIAWIIAAWIDIMGDGE